MEFWKNISYKTNTSMRIAVLILVILCFGCAKNEKSIYLQKQEISLAQPRVEATATIIDSSVIITADLRIENVAIHYTNDGSIPKKESSKYTKPLTIKKEGTYKFKAFHPDWKPSDITTLKLYDKGLKPSTINWKTNANITYPGLGDLTVLNNKKGTLNFRDTQWVGKKDL